MSEALPKSCKLLEKADFERVFKDGHRIHSQHFLVLACENDLGIARLGLAVSRKVSTKAVIRNRLKRQIRESFRKNKKLLAGLDCVVIAKSVSAKAENATLRSSLNSHWHKISDNA